MAIASANFSILFLLSSAMVPVQTPAPPEVSRPGQSAARCRGIVPATAPLLLTPFQAAALQAGCMMMQATIAGLVMLLALPLLTPRLSYYGPRVYREAVRIRS